MSRSMSPLEAKVHEYDREFETLMDKGDRLIAKMKQTKSEVGSFELPEWKPLPSMAKLLGPPTEIIEFDEAQTRTETQGMSVVEKWEMYRKEMMEKRGVSVKRVDAIRRKWEAVYKMMEKGASASLALRRARVREMMWEFWVEEKGGGGEGGEEWKNGWWDFMEGKEGGGRVNANAEMEFMSEAEGILERLYGKNGLQVRSTRG
ncbi:hypothetical protein BDZ91DRAFT_342954 [Kalaharituber pfeilii]|nr:hypothetical protein BDZ91DRAFT_342954 [Kalaharituber pfeilii]